MTIYDIIKRKTPAESLTSDNSIPWTESGFSQRMLKQHLTQEHDLGSRNMELIKKQVDWIQETILKGRISKILDLGCGPGLYTNMLAKFGHRCKGIDFSPAAIEYAHITKIELMLECEYSLADMRKTIFGKNFDLVMSLFGDFNTKTREEASRILKKTNEALKENGLALFEVFNYDVVEELGNSLSYWYSKQEGSFSSKPHIVLKDYQWIPNENYAVTRYHVIHEGNNKVDVYTERVQAYTYNEYVELFEKNGFSVVSKFQSLANERDKTGLKLFGILLKKTA